MAALHQELNRLGHTARLASLDHLTHDLAADVVVVQRHVRWESLSLIGLAQRRSCRLVFDVDDLGPALWASIAPRTFYEMIHLAQVITTSTAGYRDLLVTRYRAPRVHVLPDASGDPASIQALGRAFLEIIAPAAASASVNPPTHAPPRTPCLRTSSLSGQARFLAWQFSWEPRRAALVATVGRKCLGKVKRRLLGSPHPAPAIPAPPAAKERDYLRDWVKPEGEAYRIGVYERQRKGGSKPLIANPTLDEIRQALRFHAPQRVLEIGCGWGRLMEELVGEFAIEGCDVAPDMLRLCPPGP